MSMKIRCFVITLQNSFSSNIFRTRAGQSLVWSKCVPGPQSRHLRKRVARTRWMKKNIFGILICCSTCSIHFVSLSFNFSQNDYSLQNMKYSRRRAQSNGHLDFIPLDLLIVTEAKQYLLAHAKIAIILVSPVGSW